MNQLKKKIHHISNAYNWPIMTMFTLADFCLTFFIVSVILFFIHFGQAFPFRQAILASLVLTVLQNGTFAYSAFLVDLDQIKKEKEEKKGRHTMKEKLEKSKDLPKKCHNVNTDYAECDQFICSNCGIELQDWHQVERDSDDGDITYHEYEFRFCPNCGAKIESEE